MTGTAAWVARTDPSAIDVGLDSADAVALAGDLLARLREGRIDPANVELDDAAIDVLHAAVQIVHDLNASDAERVLKEVSRLQTFIDRLAWPKVDFRERDEIASLCTFVAWRSARRSGLTGAANRWYGRFHWNVAPSLLASDDSLLVRRRGAASAADLLKHCGSLRAGIDSRPARVKTCAARLYESLITSVEPLASDEYAFLLGELALAAGSACRVLFERSAAREWFDVSEALFRTSSQPDADCCHVRYQRLALILEERRFDEVFEQVVALERDFRRFDMVEEALKCRTLEALAIVEMGGFERALQEFRLILTKARDAGNRRLVAATYCNLIWVLANLGRLDEAIEYSCDAMPMLSQLEYATVVGKVRWALASALRMKGRRREAIDEFRAAQSAFASLDMDANVAEIRLAVADLLLQLGEDDEAIREVVAALPTIERLKLVTEGRVALSLLREVIGRGKLDRGTVRRLGNLLRLT